MAKSQTLSQILGVVNPSANRTRDVTNGYGAFNAKKKSPLDIGIEQNNRAYQIQEAAKAEEVSLKNMSESAASQQAERTQRQRDEAARALKGIQDQADAASRRSFEEGETLRKERENLNANQGADLQQENINNVIAGGGAQANAVDGPSIKKKKAPGLSSSLGINV